MITEPSFVALWVVLLEEIGVRALGDLYTHSRFVRLQLSHPGRRSSHLTLRVRQVRQPLLTRPR